jgi:hypothetical protein
MNFQLKVSLKNVVMNLKIMLSRKQLILLFPEMEFMLLRKIFMIQMVIMRIIYL